MPISGRLSLYALDLLSSKTGTSSSPRSAAASPAMPLAQDQPGKGSGTPGDTDVVGADTCLCLLLEYLSQAKAVGDGTQHLGVMPDDVRVVALGAKLLHQCPLRLCLLPPLDQAHLSAEDVVQQQVALRRSLGLVAFAQNQIAGQTHPRGGSRRQPTVNWTDRPGRGRLRHTPGLLPRPG